MRAPANRRVDPRELQQRDAVPSLFPPSQAPTRRDPTAHVEVPEEWDEDTAQETLR